MKNYADYLGINPDEMVTLYRNFPIQSQPVPMDELLERKRPGRPRLYIVLAAAIAGLAVGGQGASETSSLAANRVKFTVPVCLPLMEKE